MDEGERKRSNRHDKQNNGHDAKLSPADSSARTEAGANRESQEDGTVPAELLEARLEVVTESGSREQVQVSELIEASSGPIPHPHLYKQYPSDVQDLIKDTLRALAIEPSARENKFAKHIIALMATIKKGAPPGRLAP